MAKALAIAAGSGSHPQVDGRITVDGVDAPVEIRRDRAGVPHVFAESDEDALFGQGFVQAQDRLFQMDGMRRLAGGRLAEVAGPGSLESDRFMRRLGLADRAADDLRRAGDHERRLLEAHARGVNAAVLSLPALPPEFAVLGEAPEPWHPEHSLLLGRLLVFTFAGNWDTELIRERLLEELGPERAAEIDHVYPADAATAAAVSHLPAADRLLRAYSSAQQAGLLSGPASNAWAVAGTRTASGSPLLASDPHLQSQLPGLFHVSHIRGEAIDAIGAGIAGIPGIAIGHNGHIAWGLTAGAADVSDCYVETVDPGDPTRYLTPDGWTTGRTRIERIAVQGGETVEERVLETRHGPIVGPALPGEDRAVALRSTALEEGEIASAFLGIVQAKDGDAFEQALDRWPGASFNFVWASRDGGREGSIGYRLVGRVPRREHGHGLLPQDGARSPGRAEPLGPRELPRLIDPPEGAVVSSNNAPGSEIELGEEWFEPWRAERIRELLDARDGHDVASMQAIQLDRRSRPLELLRDLLLEAEAIDGAEVAALLAEWDGQVGAESAAAAVLELTYIELARVLVTRVAGRGAPAVLGNGVNRVVPTSSFHYRLQGPLLDALRTLREPWVQDAADRARVLRSAASEALVRLRSRLGDGVEGWSWGAMHGLRLGHPLRAVPVLGRRFSRGPYPYGGDVNTVNTGGFSVWHGLDRQGYAAAYRQVIDLGDLDASVFQLPAGNAGIPGHPHYDDCIDEYLDGRYRPLAYTREAVERRTEHVLELVPGARTKGDGA
ncbi:MAG: penicillin acylase family protein [Dehalococcoidia bacterium]